MAELPTFDTDDKPYKLGCLEPKPDFGGYRLFGDTAEIIPRSEWQDVDLSPFLHPVWDQGQHGSCVGHGSATAFHLAFRIAGGTVPPSGFSPTSLYALINGGRDRGAIVSDAMDALIKHGLATRDEVPSNVIYERQIPASAKATRKRFRALNAYHCDTFDAIGSALQLGFPVSFGIMLPGQFNTISPEGVAGLGFSMLGGHCMAAYGTKRLKDGRWALRVRNSWGSRWGVMGNCLLVEDHFTRQNQTDAFALQSSLSDPQDPSQPPVAIV